LGRLFGFGAIARSGRVSRQWTRDKSSPIVKDFVSEVVELSSKKRYLTEPAVAVILDLVRKVCLSSTRQKCHDMLLSYHDA
jgi:DNA polymerase phi